MVIRHLSWYPSHLEQLWTSWPWESRETSDIGEQHTYGRMAAEEEQSVVSRDLLLVLLLILLLIAKGRIFTQHPSLKDLKAGELRC